MDVVLLAVVSLDGCITKHESANATELSSPADSAHFRAALETCDASICGRKTYLGERPRLLRIIRNGETARLRIVMTKTPELFADDAAPGMLEFTSESPAQIVDRLRADGRKRVALLGGGEVYNRFIADNLVDEFSLTVEMRVFGTGIRLAGTQTPIDPSLHLEKVEQIGPNTVLLTLTRS
jgi:riboflavin biosynthesis pyrimidine reductase